MTKKTVAKKGAASPKKAKSSVSSAAVGAGVAAVAAAIAGTYFLYGSKNAQKHRKQVKAWSLKAKGEVLEQLEKLPEVNEKAYHAVVKEVASQYKTLKQLNPKDVVEFVGELRGHWKDIAKEVARATTTLRPKSRPAKKTAKKK
ncbi:MAG: hypothetical protein NUV61_00540 [Candidatus Azambacteria bacterium]|nr:hypothetical protein [Candidatus Azambacteria bacterium]